MSNRTIKGTLAVDYCKANPKLPDLTLGKKMFEENRNVFSSIEDARDRIRYYRGHKAKARRDSPAIEETKKPLTYNMNNYKPFKEEVETGAKILILDIETAPIRAKVWGIWNQNISIDQIGQDWFMMTWAAKWLFEDKVYSAKLTGKEALKQDDKRIVKGIWQMLNEADIVVAHNGDKFDLPRLNTRFIVHKLNPPLPYQSIDTLKHIKRQFAFTSNKLDFVNRILELPRKVKTDGFILWDKCYIGDEKSLAKMEEYNINDVRILEDTYLRLRPWIKPHPNTGLFILDEKECRCPSCGSNKLEEQGKRYYTTVNLYATYRCTNCGATARKRTTDTNIKQRRHILSSSPK